MKCYLRLKNPTGELDLVYSLDDASLMSFEDANHFRVEAFQKWPKFAWEVVNGPGKEYFVRGTNTAGQG